MNKYTLARHSSKWPIWANWSAVDANGEAYYYAEKPELRESFWLLAMGKFERWGNVNLGATPFDETLVSRDELVTWDERGKVREATKHDFMPHSSLWPEWASWTAVDANGAVFYYGTTPKAGMGEWTCSGVLMPLFSRTVNLNGFNWRDAIVRRDELVEWEKSHS